MPNPLSIKDIIYQQLNTIYPETATYEQLAKWLRKEHPDHLGVKKTADNKKKTLKELARDVKVYCYRLCKKRCIDRLGPGLVRASTNVDNLHKLEQPPLELHGIKIEAMVGGMQALQKGVHTIPFNECYEIRALADFCNSHNFKETNNGRFTISQYFCERKVTITVHVDNNAAGLVEIWINASNKPLGVQEFDKLITTILEGFLQPLGFLTNKKIVQCDVAKDFTHLRLDGISCLTLTDFKNNWYKVYYHHKTNATRMEARVTGAKMDLEGAIKLMYSLPAGIYNGHSGEYVPPSKSDGREVA